MSKHEMPEIDELLKLDNQLCFRLYAASRAVTRLYRPLLDELGITYPQYLLLMVMWQWDKEAPTQNYTLKDIGSKLQLDSGTMTPLFRRLQTRGFVDKRKGDKDGREVFVFLTDAGRALKLKAAKIPQQLSCQFADSVIPEQRQQLIERLDQLLVLLSH